MNYLFTFPDQQTAEAFLTMAEKCSTQARWISIDPNPEYDHEWRFTDDHTFDSVFTTVQEVINTNLTGNLIANTVQPVWPNTSPDEWPV